MHLPYLHWSVITLWLPGLYYVDTLDPRRCVLLSGTKMLAADPILSCKLPGGGLPGWTCLSSTWHSPPTSRNTWNELARFQTLHNSMLRETLWNARERAQIHAQTCMCPPANTPESAYIFPFVRMQVLRSPAPTPGAQGHLNSHIPGITSHPAGA